MKLALNEDIADKNSEKKILLKSVGGSGLCQICSNKFDLRWSQSKQILMASDWKKFFLIEDVSDKVLETKCTEQAESHAAAATLANYAAKAITTVLYS